MNNSNVKRGLLIAGNKSALTTAVGTEASRRVGHYVLSTIPDRFSVDNAPINPPARQADSPESACIPLEWNPGSPISARTLVLAAENRLTHITDAILVCVPPSIRYGAADINLTHVEMMVNDHIKGWFFLVKELAAVFTANGGGTLALVYPETGSGGKDDTVDLMGSTALAAFRSLTRGLLAASYTEPYLTLGFSGADTGDEAGFATFIFKQLEEGNRRNNGKLYKYGKLGLFR